MRSESPTGQQFRHRDQRQGAIGAAPGELVLRGVEVTEPHPGNKVGIGRLEGGEVTVQGQQNERVLLDVVPASLDPVGQQSSHDLGNEIRLGSHSDQSIEHDGVGAAVGMQQQIGVFGVVRDECGCPGGLDDSVVEDPLDAGFGGVVVELPAKSRRGHPTPDPCPGVPKGRGRRGRLDLRPVIGHEARRPTACPCFAGCSRPGSGLRCFADTSARWP